nr:MAG TPA: hypothetical protein [Caudoviricetes sp.]
MLKNRSSRILWVRKAKKGITLIMETLFIHLMMGLSEHQLLLH